MRTFMLVLWLLSFAAMIATAAFAADSVYVIFKNDTKEVLSVSNQDDAVVPSGYTKQILPGRLSDYPLQYNSQDYRFVANRFVANVKKISDRETANTAAGERAEEIESIKRRSYKIAYDAMVAEGVKFKYIDGTKF